MTPEIIIPRNSIWVSKSYNFDGIERSFGFIYIENKGYLLTPRAKEFAHILGLKKEGDLFTVEGRLRNLFELTENDLIDLLLNNSMFFPLEQRVKFCDVENGQLIIHGKLIHNRIHQLFARHGSINEDADFDWEEDLAKFACVTFPKTHPERGVKIMEKTNGALASFATVPAEKFTSFLEARVGSPTS